MTAIGATKNAMYQTNDGMARAHLGPRRLARWGATVVAVNESASCGGLHLIEDRNDAILR